MTENYKVKKNSSTFFMNLLHYLKSYILCIKYLNI